MQDPLSELNIALEGRYTVEREIGEGGMARVYLAQDVRHYRKVALKVLRSDVAAAVGAERFLSEIRAAAHLQHPHILPLFDSGDADGFLFYVMPFVDGPSLRDRLEKERQLPVEEAIRITLEVADALAHAHRNGIAHRDIKPANILLHEGHALVADFGVARSLGSDAGSGLTEEGHSVGTPRYMSPEQASGDPLVDQRSDIYSLGCVLYEALAGKPPFDGPTAVAIMAQALTGDPPPLSRDRPAASAVEPVVNRALQRLAADRYATADEMADALTSVLGSVRAAPQATTPGPLDASPSRNTSRWIRVGAVLVFALVVVAILSVVRSGRRGPDPVAATVAVVPFRPMGEGVEDIAAGITLTTRDRLAVLDGIEVIGGITSSAEQFGGLPAPAIASEVGADYVLRAAVERNAGGDSVEVRPELFGANGTKIGFWDGNPIVVSAADLSEVETTIAGDVAKALDLTIGAAARANLTEPRSNPAAYEVYLRGMLLSGDTRVARLREAVALDSTFALAHAELASRARLRWVEWRSPPDSADWLNHALAAVRHGPNFAGGYVEMGLFHRSITLDSDSALIYLDRARALAPGDADVMHFRASVLWTRGQIDSALVEAQRGAGLDRLNPSATSRVARILLWKHALEEAWGRHLEARPRAIATHVDFAVADGPLILLAMGQPDSARAYLSRIPDSLTRSQTAVFLANYWLMGWLVEDSLMDEICGEVSDDLWVDQIHDRQIVCGLNDWRRGNQSRARARADSAGILFRSLVERRPKDERFRMRMAYSLFLKGNVEEALIQADSSLASLNTYWDYYPGAANAVAYVRLVAMAGDAGRAVPELRLMLEGASPMTPDWLKADPAFDPIRSDPGFQALLGESTQGP
jgi:TolB-like protein